MAPTIKRGAVIIAEKWSCGFIKPTKLAQIPWLNFFSGKDDKRKGEVYNEFRKGLHKIQRDDIMVFSSTTSDIPNVKRCVCISGDSIAVTDGIVIINGQPINKSPAIYPYLITCNDEASFVECAKKNEISVTAKIGNIFRVMLNSEQKKHLVEMNYVDSVVFLSRELDIKNFYRKAYGHSVIVDTSLEKHSFLNKLYPNEHSTAYQFSNVYVPRQGDVVTLNDFTLHVYQSMVENEGNTITYKNGDMYINSTPAKEYQFRHNHYFMMGDNRMNSFDSKDWGTVTGNRLLGKVLLIWN